METIVASKRLKVASKSRTKSIEIFDIPPGSKVLAYKERKKVWTAPFIWKSYDGRKTAFVDIDKFIEPFSIVNVKKFRHESTSAGTELKCIGQMTKSITREQSNLSTMK